MYRTPMRRAQSPDFTADDVPEVNPNPPRWARSPSAGRSRRSRSRGRSPGRSHSSRSRGRSRSGSRRSRSRGRSRSRTRRSRSRGRSRSRPRRSRSRGRTRHSPSGESRYSYERRHSPTYRSAPSSDLSDSHNDSSRMHADNHAVSSPRTLDRSLGARASSSSLGDVAGKYHAVSDPPPSGYSHLIQSFQDWAKDLKRPPEEPLPMPKKSILKKRPESEAAGAAGGVTEMPTTTCLFPAANSSLVERAKCFSPANSAAIIDGQSPLLQTPPSANQNSPIVYAATEVKSGVTPKVISESGFSGSSPIVAPSSAETNAPPVTAGNQTASVGMGNAAPLTQVGLNETKGGQYASKMGNFLHMFNKSACEAQGIPYNPLAKFPDPKGAAQQKGQPQQSAVSANDPPKDLTKMAPAPKKAPERKFRSRSEIEDEERFLYGDEECKKPPTPRAEKRHPALPAPKPAAPNPAAPNPSVSTPVQSAPSPTPPAPSPAPSPTPFTSAPKDSANSREYLKIHDLLKTIGLDIGVAEIGKLAVRTQERLHGKRVVPGTSQHTPERRPSVTDPKPADSRPHKPEASPSAGKKEPGAPIASPKQELGGMPIPTLKEHTPPAQPIRAEIPVTQAIPSLSEPTPAPISPSQMPLYSPYPSTPQIMPNYAIPPPAYNPYTPYVAYPTSGWSVYPQVHQPPTTHVAPPTHAHMVLPHSTTVTRSNLRVIETSEITEVHAAAIKDVPCQPSGAPVAQGHALIAKQEAERTNKEIERKKVLEELEDLRQEQKTKKTSLDTLCAKVEQLRAQQGILLRKKRREKDGHKDPLLEELNVVMDNAQKKISVLRKELQAANQKQLLLTKVAEILGATPAELADRRSPAHASKKKDVSPTNHSSTGSGSHSNNANAKEDSKCGEPPSKSDTKSSSSSQTSTDSASGSSTSKSDSDPKSDQNNTSRSRASSSPRPEVKAGSKSPCPSEQTAKTPSKGPDSLSIDLSQLFEYYDEGYHWCEDCDSVCTTVIDFLVHMHSKKHLQMVNPPRRPWAKKTEHLTKPPGRQMLAVPMKGLEFLFPTNGFYCQLCEELFADQTCAEQHLRTFAHNDKYKKYTDDNPHYEHKRQNKQKAVAEEAPCWQKDEQKRKLSEPMNEGAGESKSKRTRKEEEESAKQKQSSAAPPSAKPEPRQNPKHARAEPAKTQAFGKFSWKPQESKSQTAAKDENAARDKEEEGKAHGARNKSIEIKLMCTSGGSHSSSSSAASPNSQTKVRPNLPVPMSVLRKSGVAPLSKPAPLNAFLSIKSSSKSSSKPLKAEETPQDVSKTSGAQDKRELPQKQAAGKPVSGSEFATKKAAESSTQKSDCQKMPPPPHSAAGAQRARSSEAFDMFRKSKDSEKKPSPNLHPASFKAAGTKAEKKKEEPSAARRNESSKSPVFAGRDHISNKNQNVLVSSSISPSSSKPSQRAAGEETAQGAKTSTGQETKAKASANSAAPKGSPSNMSGVTPQSCATSPLSQQLKTSPEVIPPVDAVEGPGSAPSTTAKLIQKFKREPLPLPTTLFCHGPDKLSSSLRLPNAGSSAAIIISKNQTFPGHTNARPKPPEGSETYYKLVASEDDPDDVTTSEDQDAEAEAPVGVVALPVQLNVAPPEKKADKPPVKMEVPDSTEDADDSDMACEEEAPEAPDVTVFTGPPISSSCNAAQHTPPKTHATPAASKSPLGTVVAKEGTPNMDEVQMDISPEYSMEDLAAMTTCDSD